MMYGRRVTVNAKQTRGRDYNDSEGARHMTRRTQWRVTDRTQVKKTNHYGRQGRHTFWNSDMGY